ncbi:MAG: hypothetical protein V3S09_02240 [Candidatus Bathyarchaeia archaeon]
MSSSTSIGNYLSKHRDERGLEVETQWLREVLPSEERTSQMLESVGAANTIIVIAPLYDDCQPYLVTKTMELIADQGTDNSGKRFIPIVNCGFPEHQQITAVAIPIYRRFASTVGFRWAGSLAIGGGETIQGAIGKQLEDIGNMANELKERLGEISESLATDTQFPDTSMIVYPSFFLNPIMSKISVWMNKRGWKAQAKKNGGVVDAAPYA